MKQIVAAAVALIGALLTPGAALASVTPSAYCIDRDYYLRGISAWDLPGLPVHLTGDARLCIAGGVPSQPVAALAVVPDGEEGYWSLGEAGEVKARGGARFLGEVPAGTAGRVVDIAASPTGRGYWLVAADGGVFAFGDATFFGSAASVVLAEPVVAISAMPTGGGYVLASRDGGVFAYGDAPYLGSPSVYHPVLPVVDIALTGSGRGYWLITSVLPWPLER